MTNGQDDMHDAPEQSGHRIIKIESDIDEDIQLIPNSLIEESRQKLTVLWAATNNERARILHHDSRIDIVEPKRVLCKMCGRWIRLNDRVAYSPTNWRRHAERCQVKNNWNTMGASGSVLSLPDGNSSENAQLASTVNSPTFSIKTLEYRKNVLVTDPRAKAVEPHQVLCAMCDNWVKLHNSREYDAWNWHMHVDKCQLKYGGAIMIDSRSSSGVRGALRPESNTSPNASMEAIVSTRDRATELNEQLGMNSLDSSQAAGTESAINMQLQHVDESGVQVGEEIGMTKSTENIEHLAHVDSYTYAVSVSPKPIQENKVRTERPLLIIAGTTAEERKEQLMRDGRCEQIEPHRVFCKLCLRFIGLHNKAEYATTNWFRHIRGCVTRPRPTGPEVINQPDGPFHNILPTKSLSSKDSHTIASADNEAGSEINGSILDQTDESSKNAESSVHGQETKLITTERREKRRRSPDILPAAGSISQASEFSLCNEQLSKESTPPRQLRPRHTTDPQKHPKSLPTAEETCIKLKEDKRLLRIEPHRVLCKVCNTWIKLKSDTSYGAQIWTAHIAKCESKRSVPDNSYDGHAHSSPLIAEGQSIFDQQLAHAPAELTSEIQAASTEDVYDFLTDPRCARVMPQHIMCNICHQWIKIFEEKEYAPGNWSKHVDQCEKDHSMNLDAEEPVMPNPPLVISSPSENKGTTSPSLNHMQRKKTDEERQAELLADPRQAGVQRGKVLCKMCNKWIKLNSSNAFLATNWLRHASRCEKIDHTTRNLEAALRKPIRRKPKPAKKIDLNGEKEEKSENEGKDETESHGASSTVFGTIELAELMNCFEPAISSIDFMVNPIERRSDHEGEGCSAWSAPSSRPQRAAAARSGLLNPKKPEVVSSRRSHRTEAERKAELEDDPRTDVVMPSKILCALCGRWIQTRRDVSYSNQNWQKHVAICELRELKYGKPEGMRSGGESPPGEPLKDGTEENLPYNARHCKGGEYNVSESYQHTLHPVDWNDELNHPGNENDYSMSSDAESASTASDNGTEGESGDEQPVPIELQTQVESNPTSFLHFGIANGKTWSPASLGRRSFTSYILTSGPFTKEPLTRSPTAPPSSSTEVSRKRPRRRLTPHDQVAEFNNRAVQSISDVQSTRNIPHLRTSVSTPPASSPTPPIMFPAPCVQPNSFSSSSTLVPIHTIPMPILIPSPLSAMYGGQPLYQQLQTVPPVRSKSGLSSSMNSSATSSSSLPAPIPQVPGIIFPGPPVLRHMHENNGPFQGPTSASVHMQCPGPCVPLHSSAPPFTVPITQPVHGQTHPVPINAHSINNFLNPTIGSNAIPNQPGIVSAPSASYSEPSYNAN